MKENVKPRIFLFDAYAIIYRAYYAFIKRPMINSKGLNTSAIYGFTNILFDILNREKPEYAAVVFDPPSPTFRNKLYKPYKANRLTTPEEIIKSVPVIKQIIQAFNVQIIEVQGYEADDVIGTIAKRAETEGLITYMVTQDKDYMQLVSDSIYLFKPSKDGNKYEIIGPAEVGVIFGVNLPIEVIDVLGLWGDTSDNIPGAPGIGEKSAKELVYKYGSIENIFKNLDKLKPKQKDSLLANKDQVMLSKQLATICLEVPVDSNFNGLILKQADSQKMNKLFKELEFRSLASKIFKDTQNAPVQQTLFENTLNKNEVIESSFKSIINTSHQYIVIEDIIQLELLIDILLSKVEFCFDIETTGLIPHEVDIVGMAISFETNKAYYIPFSHDYTATITILNKLKPVFENDKIKKIGQNLKFDLQILMKYNITVQGELFDTMIAHYLIMPDLRHNLNYLSEIYLQYKMIPIEDLIGQKGPKQKNMQDIAIPLIKEYACEDADITWQIYKIISVELLKSNQRYLAENVEMPLVGVLGAIEFAGFKIDQHLLKTYSEVLKGELGVIETGIYDHANIKFNINSPKQLGEVLFQKMQIAENVQKTKTKQYSTSEEVLVKLTDKHPIIAKILEYRTIQKLLSTYVEALPLLISKKTGKVHTSFDQAFVSTGRLSSRNPNLQNIPIRDQRGKEIRRAFIADDEQHILISADYSQIELRLMAHLSEDENMIEAFLKNADIHVSTAAKIFKVSENQVTTAMRSKAKTANFGIIYGISAFGLSQRLNITKSEASALIDGYFESFPKVKAYMEHSIRWARDKGYVETIMGRHRFLPDIHSKNAIVRGVAERNAINAPIQGSAADIIKLAMVNIQKRIRHKFKSTMILQVHDELIFNVLLNELDQIKEIVKYEMEHVIKIKVPLTIDIGVGRNWLEAH
jgi:DNA polymerase I